VGRLPLGALTQAASLLDGDGGLPSAVEAVWERADLDEVRRECRAQIELALSWGLDLTHLDSHLQVLQRPPDLFAVYLELAAEFGLPVHPT